MYTTTEKENSVSARIQRRKPVIGEKSSGGLATTIMSAPFSGYFICKIAKERISTGNRKPSASTRNIIRARKQYCIPGVSYIHTPFFGPENPFLFRETAVFYHHKKDDMPREKTLKNDKRCYFPDRKNHHRRKSRKGTMKQMLNINDY